MKHIKLFEQINEDPFGEESNSKKKEYPRNIIDIFERIGCYEDEYGRFIGRRNKFTLEKDKLICLDQNNNVLFSIKKNISSGAFIVLLQEFRIIHNRYIYERIGVIEEEFFEQD